MLQIHLSATAILLSNWMLSFFAVCVHSTVYCFDGLYPLKTCNKTVTCKMKTVLIETAND